MRTRLFSRAASIGALTALFAVGLLQAQTETGQITGSVLDASGAVVANASITVTDQATNTARKVTSNGTGLYVVANLQPGDYQVAATASGFSTTQRVVNVGPGDRVGLDIRLSVGQQSQVVEVQEQAPPVNTETQSVGQTISRSEIQDLPTITRNPYALISTVGNTTDADPTSATRGVGVSINGLRASDVGILLDGVPNKNSFDSKVGIATPLDSVGEIQVLTNNFTAEYGQALAGVINVDTKRGTNSIHGSVYEFNRVSALTSNTFDNNANGIGISPFVRNQFGFSIGGPVKKNKLFVFYNPEWLRVRSNATVTATIATPQLIAASAPNTQAFFSAFGQLSPGVAVLQTFAYSKACTSAACTLLAANTPAYEKVAYSVPTDAGGGSPQNSLDQAGRVDYVLSDKTQIYFRYARLYATLFPGTVTSSPYAGYNTGESDYKNGLALSGTHIFSPSLISQTKLSFNRVGIYQGLSTGPIAPTLYTTLSATSSLGNAPINYPGYSPSTPGNSVPFGGPQNYYQVNEDLTKIWGKHSIRFGGLYTLLQDNRTFGAYEEAVAALGTNLSTSVNNLINGQLVGFQAAIYPQGKFPCVGGVVTAACTLTLPVGPPNFSRSNRQHAAALYTQDAWKVTPRLTVNLGLRWEYFGPQANKNGNLDSNFYFGSGTNIETESATGTVQIASQSPVGGLWAKDWHDFAPRLGLAWDVFGDGKTSLRGGYGIGYSPNFGNVTFNVIQNPPNYGVIGLTAGVDVPSIPITNNNAGPLAGSSGTKALGIVTLRAVDPNIKTAYAQLWSAVLEHQFSSDFIGALEYSASKGTNLYSIDRLNIPGSAAVYGTSTSATARINPQYSYINYRTNGGFSDYNGLNFRGEFRNFRRQGLTLRTNFTWSHAIDNLSSTFSETNSGAGNLGFTDPLNPGLDKGNADFDVRKRFNVVGVWAEPFKSSNKVLDSLLGGWSVVPNLTARSGTPFTVYDCTNAGYVICPRIMYDSQFTPVYTQKPTGNPNEFDYLALGNFDSSYANPKAGVSDFGPYPSTMTGRNVFTTPGVWNFDLGIHKTFTVRERYRLQLRAEAFNVFNHSNLYIVYSNTDASATNFITATRGQRNDNNGLGASAENRNVQLAVRVEF